METKSILTLGAFFILSTAAVAQSNIRITDDNYEAKNCGKIENVYKQIDLEKSSLYQKWEKKPLKGHYEIYVRDNETCQERKTTPFPSIEGVLSAEFISSPKKQFALLVEKDYSYNPKDFMR